MKVLKCFRHIHIVNRFLAHSVTMKGLDRFRHVHYVDMSNATLKHNVLEHNDMPFFSE
jgi:hypothetical protein